MANTGPDLIDAILSNDVLMNLNNCPAVPVNFGKAVYGSLQNDVGKKSIAHGDTQVNEAVGFAGSNGETAVWHFSIDSPVHHFCVVPWYKHDNPHGRVYTVFMAYENQYTVRQYVGGLGTAPTGPGGYKLTRTADELSTMLLALVNSNAAWQNYFGQVGPARTMKLDYYKYKVISLEKAIANVRRYAG